jgi:hypothetical protein
VRSSEMPMLESVLLVSLPDLRYSA